MNYKHGQACRGKITPEYRAWESMRDRCLDPNNIFYEDYGGRGITIYPRWIDSFIDFFNYIGKKPSNKHSLDRMDNDGDYVPGNIQWATKREQSYNKRNTVIIDFNGESKTLIEWAEEIGIKTKTLAKRLRVGWTVERALTSSHCERKYTIEEYKITNPEDLSEVL